MGLGDTIPFPHDEFVSLDGWHKDLSSPHCGTRRGGDGSALSQQLLAKCLFHKFPELASDFPPSALLLSWQTP